MRAVDKFFIQESILQKLAAKPQTTNDLRAQVSGTRGDIIAVLLQLKEDRRIDTDDSVPRRWRLKGISYE